MKAKEHLKKIKGTIDVERCLYILLSKRFYSMYLMEVYRIEPKYE